MKKYFKQVINDKHWYVLTSNHHSQIKEWFDPNTFDWNYSKYLVMYCYKDFDFWWDPNKFDWKYWYMIQNFCNKEFINWFWNHD